MSRLKLSTIEIKIKKGEYVCFKDLPQKTYCPDCNNYTAEKIITRNDYISGTGFVYACSSCDFSRENII